ncbi:MAG: GNAT family N-acetyltransferase [Planctomycetaceae bacterium]|nr:GNAT family N-acetyltransferase [Planctomycetaceae bacterium]
MFYRIVNDQIQLHLTHPHQTEELFALTDRNREFLKQWLPWLDKVQGPEDSRHFLKEQLQKYAEGTLLTVLIYYEGKIAGVMGFHQIGQSNRTAEIGYWLGEEYNGRGIITACVRELIKIGQEYLKLQKIIIRCATDNARSRAVPLRLGFELEGTFRRAENLHGRWIDINVFGLLLEENSHEPSD